MVAGPPIAAAAADDPVAAGRCVDLLAAHGLRPSRALGQNFVVDPNTVRRIARLAGVGPGDHVVEIGAGLGSLTLALAETGAAVTAVEIDRHLVPVLREVVEPRRGAPSSRATRCASTGTACSAGGRPLGAGRQPALQRRHAAGARPAGRRAGHRADAGDGAARGGRAAGRRRRATPAYGIPSVKVAYWATAEVVGRVPPTVFLPRPRVESALVRIVRRPEPRGRRRRRPCCSAWSTPGSASGARCCAARWPPSSTPPRSRRPASAPRPGPRS